MSVRLIFGEAFRLASPSPEMLVDASECKRRPCSIGRLLESAGIDQGLLDGTRSEVPALVMLNDRVLSPADRFSALVEDGDTIRFEVMLTGG